MIAPIALMIAVAHVLNKLEQRFRADRDERRRHAAVADVPPVPRGRHRRVADGGGDQRLPLAEGPARAARAGRPRCAPTSSPTSSSPVASPSIEGKLTLHIRERQPNGQSARHLGRRPARPEGARRPSWPSRATSSRTTAAPTWCCETGSVQRHEAGERDPTIVAVRPLRVRSVALRAGAAEHPILGAGTLSRGSCFDPAPDDPLLTEQPGAVPRRAAQPDHGAALSARLPGHDLCLSRRAAHDAAEPRAVAGRRHRRRSRCCAAIGFVGTLVGAQTPIALVVALSRAGRRRSSSAICGDLARPHHRAAGLHHQHDQRAGRAAGASAPPQRRGRRT